MKEKEKEKRGGKKKRKGGRGREKRGKESKEEANTHGPGAKQRPGGTEPSVSGCAVSSRSP